MLVLVTLVRVACFDAVRLALPLLVESFVLEQPRLQLFADFRLQQLDDRGTAWVLHKDLVHT